MAESLKQLTDDAEKGRLLTTNLRLYEEIFENEIIEKKELYQSIFVNLELKNIKFINVDFEKMYCSGSSFESCVFENIIFKLSEFNKSSFKNCSFIKCDFAEAEFKKIIFVECQFLTNENGSNNFEDVKFTSCHFDKTRFIITEPGTIFGTILTDSKFSLSQRSIKFSGSFYLWDLLLNKGIHEMFT